MCTSILTGWHVLRYDEALQQSAERLHVRDVRDGRDLLEAVLHHLRHGGDVLVEEDRQVGLLRLVLAGLDPGGHVRVPAEVAGVDVQDPSSGKEVLSRNGIFHLLISSPPWSSG